MIQAILCVALLSVGSCFAMRERSEQEKELLICRMQRLKDLRSCHDPHTQRLAEIDEIVTAMRDRLPVSVALMYDVVKKPSPTQEKFINKLDMIEQLERELNEFERRGVYKRINPSEIASLMHAMNEVKNAADVPVYSRKKAEEYCQQLCGLQEHVSAKSLLFEARFARVQHACEELRAKNGFAPLSVLHEKRPQDVRSWRALLTRTDLLQPFIVPAVIGVSYMVFQQTS